MAQMSLVKIFMCNFFCYFFQMHFPVRSHSAPPVWDPLATNFADRCSSLIGQAWQMSGQGQQSIHVQQSSQIDRQDLISQPSTSLIFGDSLDTPQSDAPRETTETVSQTQGEGESSSYSAEDKE